MLKIFDRMGLYFIPIAMQAILYAKPCTEMVKASQFAAEK